MLKILAHKSILLFLLAISLFGAHKAHAALTVKENLAVPQGLVGYWNFDQPSGDRVQDKSGNGNTGVMTNMVANPRVPSNIGLGQALSFDGVNDYVSMNNISALNSASFFTISAWFQRNSSGAFGFIGQGSSAANREELQIWSDGQIYFAMGTSIWGNFASNDTNWHHIVIVYDGTQGGNAARLKIYLDGKNQSLSFTGTIPATSATATGNFLLGLDAQAGGQYAKGLLDDVRIYNRALTQAEITRIYNSRKPQVLIDTAPTTNSLTKGLVGYWSLDGKTVSKTTALDTSGNGNNGTLTGGVVPTQGKIGQGLKFDGVNDTVTIANSASNNITGNQSASAWIKYNASVGSGTIVHKYLQSFLGQYVGVNTGNVSFNIRQGTWKSASYATSNFVVGKWYHLVGVYDGINVILYVNGAVVATTALTGLADSSVLGASIGGAVDATNFVAGLIDDVRIYNRALSAAEIKRLYTGTAGSFINVAPNNNSLSKGLVGYWSMDGKSTTKTTTLDTSGNGNTGTLTNGVVPTAGKIGQALSFDGVNDYVDVGNASLFNFERTDSFSSSAWIYLNSTTPVAEGIVGRDQAVGGVVGWNMIAFRRATLDSTALSVFITNTSATNGIEVNSGANTLTSGKWYHVVFIYSGNSLASGVKLYINGVLQTNTVVTDNLSASIKATRNLLIGARDSTAPTQFLNGSIDDVRIYNRALTGAEIQRLYNGGR